MNMRYLIVPILLAAASMVAMPVYADDKRNDDKEEKNDDRDHSNREKMNYRGLDRNNDGQISRAEWRGDDRSFANQDWNGDGVLSGNEVHEDWRHGKNKRYGSNDLNARFAALDRNNNGVIGSAEWNGDRATFDRLDTSRNGNLSREEFARWDDRYGNNDSNARFAALDRNNNGVIGSAEWNGDRATFNRLDTSRNGNLSRDEFARWDGRYGNNDASSRFAALDRNNNGVIGSAEWNGDRATFDRLDTDRNGNLSRDEFMRGSGLSWAN
jgi:Ca2+-binding EF-hand superfamily protein